MKFEFEQTTDDILDLSKNSLRSSKLIKFVILGLLLFVLVSLVKILLQGGAGLSVLLSWFYPIVLFSVLWFFIFKYLLKKRLTDAGSKSTLLGRQIIELGIDEIRIENSASKTILQWAAISTLGESKKSYFLHLSKAQALIFPKRAFDSADAEDEFKKLVNEKLTNR